MASEKASTKAAGSIAKPQPSNEDVDERTVFVRSLPFSVTDAQLEDIFSEVGPVRNCFTVKEKGAELHRGFGFVQFAVKEDAHRAVEAKNGATLQGRQIKVELAKRRAPLDQRRPLPKSKDSEEVRDAEGEATQGSGDPAVASKDEQMKKRKASEGEDVQPNTGSPEVAEKGNKKFKREKQAAAAGLPSLSKKRPREEGKSSDSQRPARTVIVGSLENPKMVQSVIAKAKKIGSVEDVRHPLDEAELISRGLAKDGCKQGAAAIVYTSVKVACQAVAALHKQILGGGVVWARQLGGEGAKLKKWRLIVRNLPFMLKEQTLRELFSPSGFVWEITIPRKPDTSSKGFAFVGFTCKADAEKAIKAVNGKLVGKRPVAVDWAVAKKEFETAAAKNSLPEENEDDDQTASEDESGEGSEDGDEEDSDVEEAAPKVVIKVTKKVKADDSSPKLLHQKQAVKKAVTDMENSDEEDESDESMSEDDDEHPVQDLDLAKEQDMVKRLLEKVVNTQAVTETQANGNADSEGKQRPKQEVAQKKEMKSTEAVQKKKLVEEKATKPAEAAGQKGKKPEKDGEVSAPVVFEEDGLKRTVFVRNLPLDSKVPDMRRQFSAFGEVKSFRLVLHPITKRPKGTAFLEFATSEGAQAAVNAANGTGEDGGMLVGGRKLTLNLALDRDQAKQVAKQMSKEQDDHDRRHLKLAKEGLIEEGTPAAEGVSKGDMLKRKQVEHEKATKLRSPNFHVSTTRLAVHNIPKDMSEKELKQLFIKAVKARASKQQPVVKQVKILRDEVKGIPNSGGKSRGAAFVEFTEHQHALVALRVLNNNPETFGTEHRPIIEFAIENSQILRKRAARAELDKNRLARRGPAVESDGGEREGHGSEKKSKRKREQRSGREKAEKKETAVGEKSANENAEVKDGDKPAKRKRERKDWKRRVDEKAEGAVPSAGVNSETGGAVASKGKKKNNKRQKRDEGTVGSEAGLGKKSGSTSQKSTPTKPPQHTQKSEGEANGRPPKSPSAKSPKFQKGRAEQTGKPSPGKVAVKAPKEETRRDRKRPQVVDKLDQLVAEYRTKYFSSPSAGKDKGDAKPVGDLKRWFE